MSALRSTRRDADTSVVQRPAVGRRHRLRGSGATRLLAVLAAGLLVGAAVLGGSSSAAFTAQLRNDTDTVATSSFFTCTGAETAPGKTVTYLDYPLNEASGTSAADVSGNARTGTYTASGVTYGVSGPCTRDKPSTAVTLDGAKGYVLYTAETQNTNTFTEGIWFRTTTTTGGKLLGWGNSKTASTSGSYDRHIYMANNGFVYFGVYPGSAKVITNSRAYNDGRWHQVVASLSTAGMVLHVDGVQVAQDTTVTTAESYAGYLHVGFDNLSGWTAAPTSQYFAGSLAHATYSAGTALTAQQVKDQYVAGT